jgi:hypothetical protein
MRSDLFLHQWIYLQQADPNASLRRTVIGFPPHPKSDPAAASFGPLISEYHGQWRVLSIVFVLVIQKRTNLDG